MRKIISVLLRLLGTLFGIFFLLGTLGGIISCFMLPTNELIFTVPFTIILLLIGILILRISLKNHNRRQSPKSNTPTLTTFSSSVPQSTLTAMKETYTATQINRDIQILKDSVRLINSTSSLETFFSRYELALKKIMSLEQAKQAGIKVSTAITSDYVMSIRRRADEVLTLEYQKELKAIETLKTISGKKNRIDRFISKISEFYDEFEFSNTYRSILTDLNEYKKQLNSKKGEHI